MEETITITLNKERAEKLGLLDLNNVERKKFDKIQDDIRPFVRKRTIVQPTTGGKWKIETISDNKDQEKKLNEAAKDLEKYRLKTEIAELEAKLAILKEDLKELK